MTLTQFKALKTTIVSISSNEVSIFSELISFNENEIIEGELIKEEDYFGNILKYKNSIIYTVSIPKGIIEIDSYRFQKLT
jgi:hypothetical protein